MQKKKHKIIYFQFGWKNIQCSTWNFLSPKQALEVSMKRLALLPKAAMKRSFWRYTNTTRPLCGWNRPETNHQTFLLHAQWLRASVHRLKHLKDGTIRYVLSTNSLQLTECTIPQDTVWVALCARKQRKHNSNLHNCASNDWRQNVRSKVKIVGTICNRLCSLSQLLAQISAGEPF